MTFPEFLDKWRKDTLDTDAAWRAYDIVGSIRPRHVKRALKFLGLSYAGEHAIPEFMARYYIEDRAEAETILGAWAIWQGLNQGFRLARRADPPAS